MSATSQETARVYESAGAELTHGVFQPGIDAESMAEAIEDPSSIKEPVSGIALAVPVQHYRWLQPEYFTDQLTGRQRQELLFYTGWEELAAVIGIDHAAMTESLVEAVVDRDATLLFEQSPQRNERPAFDAALAALGITHYDYPHLQTILRDKKNQPHVMRPDHHVYFAHFTHEQEASLPVEDVYGAHDEAFGESGPTLLVPKMSEITDLSEMHADYTTAFSDVLAHDPLAGVLSKDEFITTMDDPSVLKFVHIDTSDRVANVLVVSPIQDYPWFNQRTMSAEFGSQYAQRKVLNCPEIYRHPDASEGLSLNTVARFVKTCGLVGVRDLVIECNDVSNRYVTRLLELGTKKAATASVRIGGPVVSQSVVALAPA